MKREYKFHSFLCGLNRDHDGFCEPAAAPAPQAEHAKLRILHCAECDVPLNVDGTCPKCRDANGNPFILDMQSTYLAAPAETARPGHIAMNRDGTEGDGTEGARSTPDMPKGHVIGETAGEMTAEQFVLASGFRQGSPVSYKAFLQVAESFAKQRVEQAECENEELQKSLARSTSPCGHLAQYAKTEDGGKHIICLVCEVADLERERDTLVRELCDMTPGGSEFVGDAKRCLSFIRDRMDSVVKQVKLRQAAESELREMREALFLAIKAYRYYRRECLETCPCDICGAERLLARKAGS